MRNLRGQQINRGFDKGSDVRPDHGRLSTQNELLPTSPTFGPLPRSNGGAFFIRAEASFGALRVAWRTRTG
jgi:hypothetical protein